MSVILWLVTPFSTVFYIFYTLCGLSDMMDGYMARKMNCVSKRGEILDSLADMVFLLVMFVIIIPAISWHLWMIVWITVIALI